MTRAAYFNPETGATVGLLLPPTVPNRAGSGHWGQVASSSIFHLFLDVYIYICFINVLYLS